VIGLARKAGWTIEVGSNDDMYCPFKVIAGFEKDWDKTIGAPGIQRKAKWFETESDALKQQSEIARIPFNELARIVVGPLARSKVNPDTVIIYGNTSQICLMLNALQWKDYHNFDFSFIGESSCSDLIARSYLSGDVSLSIPCYGEFVYGGVSEDELSIAVPFAKLEKLIFGLKSLRSAGIRYPIVPIGDMVNGRPFSEQNYGRNGPVKPIR
jgi:hypothetical protein